MEYNIDKEQFFEDSLAIVKDVFKDQLYDLSEQDFRELTIEIMDTCLLAGGDYDSENIRFYANEYIKKNFYHRFKKARGAF